MDRINLFKELEEGGYKVFLATSYTSDLVFFERMLLRPLLNHQCTYIGLYLDHHQLTDQHSHWDSVMELGQSYVVKGIPLNSAFHPKIYLMLGEDKAKLILGSGNLTPAGFITNIEVFNSFTYVRKEEGGENLHLIQSASAMFQDIHHRFPSKAMKSIMDKMEEFSYLKMEAKKGDRILLHNVQRSIYQQIQEQLQSPIQQIDILVPYFDQQLSVIKQFQRDYQLKDIRILLQDGSSNFPFEGKVSDNIPCKEVIYKNHGNKRYHGKIFCIHTQDKEYMLYGSANCSRQALLESMDGGGNLEACILEEMPEGNIQGFFMEECELREIQGTLNTIELTTNIGDTIPVLFKEAFRKEDQIKAYFQSKEPINEILLNGLPAKLVEEEGVVLAIWDGDFTNLSSMFKFIVRTKCHPYTIIGWVHDEEALKRNQLQLEGSIYSRIKDDPLISDYKNIVDLLEDLLDRLILDEEGMQRKNIRISGASSTNRRAELSGDEEVSDDIEDYYVPEEEQQFHSYGSMGGIDVLGELIHQLLQPFSKLSKQEQSNPGEKTEKTTTTSNRKKSQQEIEITKHITKKMNAFIKKFNKGLASENFLREIPQDILITNIVIYTQFLRKLSDKMGNFPIINEEEFIQQWVGVIEGLCRYGHENLLDHEHITENILPYCFAIIMTMDQRLDQNENFKEVRIERRQLGQLLEDIDAYIHPIREAYMTYLPKTLDIMREMHLGVQEEIGKLADRLEKKFTYMSFTQFEKIIQGKYELEQEVIPSKTEVVLREELKFNYYFNLDKVQLLCRMINVIEWRDEERFFIKVHNTQKENNKSQWTLTYETKNKVLRQITSFKNGNEIVQIKRNVLKSDIILADDRQNDQFLVEGFKVK